MKSYQNFNTGTSFHWVPEIQVRSSAALPSFITLFNQGNSGDYKYIENGQPPLYYNLSKQQINGSPFNWQLTPQTQSSSSSTPDTRSEESHPSSNNYAQLSKPWLKIAFAPSNPLFYKDSDKSSKSVKVTSLPNIKYPVLYVERGKIVDVTLETNYHSLNSTIKFDVYTLKGSIEEPVYGVSEPINGAKSTANGENLCFIQAVELDKTNATYSNSNSGFLTLSVPFKQNPYTFSVMFPFLNFKCSTSSKKIVYLRVSVCNDTGRTMLSYIYQLVSCSSPQRDYKRHFDRLSGLMSTSDEQVSDTNYSTKKIRYSNDNVDKECSNENENPQYVIMTKNYEIWKILNIIHQQLVDHFKSKK